jgi:putative transcriptional regulator
MERRGTVARAKGRQKKRLGARIVEGLADLRDTLKSGKPVEKRFTVRTIELDLEPGEYDAESVKCTRLALGVSQAVFARVLGASGDTVASWEQGVREPTPMARRLLDEINRNRDYWLQVLRDAATEKVGG